MPEWHAGDKVRVKYIGHWYDGIVYRVERRTIRVEFATCDGATFKQRAFGHADSRVQRRLDDGG